MARDGVAIMAVALAADGDRELARDNFRLLPWTSAADRVNCLRMPPRCREHVMLGFSQIIRPLTPVAVSVPGDEDADGCDRPVTRLRRQAHPPLVIREA